ncbi:uncharacterized protein PGTG_01276 [Puccinia graminis f. sp. tritici CRL 75-36-700-3]|uniref:Uncharacterized protein n=1 Tax=Puccinia graminis f. sp. tritici (strain CRL 75-36-700-3 / race SCCL) TaxID=418459 RepID=E3JV70_PUCGT|nr:uncharacterized protein PGTG_01276 [Puccinia graminis f. sp. tritici CRL 75-36-700-3]EFP75945.2 hypothetical protein PGTG_01276 [Puccinia graminis f. sp. tritici CRL 75-36-700-3]
MFKIDPFAVKIGCTTSFIQAGQVVSATLLAKRAPQRTASENAPLILYGSDSSPTVTNPASTRVSSHSVLFVVLSGASAFSIITLAFVMIYCRYKAHNKFGISRLSSPTGEPGRVNAGSGYNSSVEKSQIRHITHDEQKERYRSLFGVPAGYLRPKSRISLAPPPAIHSLQVTRYSDSVVGLQNHLGNHSRSSSSLEIQDGDSETSLCQIALTGNGVCLDVKDRNTRLISFEEESARQIREYRSADQEIRISRFSHRFPNLVARLKTIKQKTSRQAKPTYRPTPPYSLNPQTPDNFHSILTSVSEVSSEGITEEELHRFRSSSIAPTPPSYIKSPTEEHSVAQRPVDLAIVTDRLEHHVSVQRATMVGRGDSYYWKSPPRSE